MQSTRRFHYNFGLEYAVSWANKLAQPLLISEAFSCNYRWATDRSHTFMMRGMKEHLDFAKENNLSCITFCEEEHGQLKEMFMKISESAPLVISDEFPDGKKALKDIPAFIDGRDPNSCSGIIFW